MKKRRLPWSTALPLVLLVWACGEAMVGPPEFDPLALLPSFDLLCEQCRELTVDEREAVEEAIENMRDTPQYCADLKSHLEGMMNDMIFADTVTTEWGQAFYHDSIPRVWEEIGLGNRAFEDGGNEFRLTVAHEGAHSFLNSLNENYVEAQAVVCTPLT